MHARCLSYSLSALVLAQSNSAIAAVPISGWKIEPSDSRCVAVRQYGNPGRPTTLAFKASSIDDAIQLAVIRPGLRANFVQSPAKLEIDDQKIPTSALSYPTGGDARRVTHLINVDPGPTAALRSAKILKLAVTEGVHDSFALEPSADIWKEMQNCVSRLRDVWNIGEQYEGRIAKGATGDLQAVVSGADYPVVSARTNQQGTAAFIILIDEKGVPKDCTIFGSSGSAALDSRSCGVILERGRFSPAIGIDGKPVKSAFVKRMTWRLY
jgi:hypothetical protein